LIDRIHCRLSYIHGELDKRLSEDVVERQWTSSSENNSNSERSTNIRFAAVSALRQERLLKVVWYPSTFQRKPHQIKINRQQQ
jgi:hypothetical protein